MALQGEFENGKLHAHKYFMDGEIINLIGNGEIDLAERTTTSPFKLLETINPWGKESGE